MSLNQIYFMNTRLTLIGTPISIVLIAFLGSIPIEAQLPNHIDKWETIEIEFRSKKLMEEPFKMDLFCAFFQDDSDTLMVPGFFNGDKQWIVRFTPPREGTWNCISHADLKEMDGIRKTILVGPNKDGNHGPLYISTENPSTFCFADGTAYHLLAFEADWLFALDYGNPELAKTRQLLDAIAGNGFNQVIFNVYAFDAPWPKDPDLIPEYNYGGNLEIFPFGGDNENPDYSTLNIDFFKHLDGVVELLGQNNLFAHMMIYVWNKGVNWPEAGSEADQLYFDYVVKRYQAYPHLLWDISKEALGYGHNDMAYISDQIDRLRGLDAYDRLLTVHDYGYCSAFPDKVDYISVQNWKSDLYSQMLKIRQDFPGKPVFNIEHGGYEEGPYTIFIGDYKDPVACLKRNYFCAFAGLYSCYYWQGTSWYSVIHDPFSANIIPQPKFIYYKYFSEFMDRIGFNNLHPSESNGTSGLCLMNGDLGIYVYYIPADNSALIAQNLAEASSISLQWFNPITGEYSEKETKKWRKNIRVYQLAEGQDQIAILKLIR